jgi:hypothetical protein
MLLTQGESIFEALLTALLPLFAALHILAIALKFGSWAEKKPRRKDIDPPFGRR